MQKCPYCGRKIDAIPPYGTAFTMPEHLNYMKTDTCLASGKQFALLDRPTPRMNHAALAMALLYLGGR